MIVEELLDSLGLVGGEVVEDDVDLLAGGLTGDEILEEGDEFLAGVVADGLAQNGSGLGVQGGVQRQSAVSNVLEAMSLGSPWGERKNRVLAVKGLDGRFLIHAEDGRMLRRVDIQAEDVGGLALEVGVVRGHVALHAMGLDPVLLPGPGHHHVMQAQFLRESPGAPVGRSIGGRLLRPGQDASLHARRQHLDLAALVPGVEPGQSLLDEPFLPLANEGSRAGQLLLDLRIRDALGQQQDDASDAGVSGSALSAPNSPLELGPFPLAQNDQWCSHEENHITKRSSVTVH